MGDILSGSSVRAGASTYGYVWGRSSSAERLVKVLRIAGHVEDQ